MLQLTAAFLLTRTVKPANVRSKRFRASSSRKLLRRLYKPSGKVLTTYLHRLLLYMDFFTGYSNNKGVGKVSTKLKETNVSHDESLNHP